MTEVGVLVGSWGRRFQPPYLACQGSSGPRTSRFDIRGSREIPREPCRWEAKAPGHEGEDRDKPSHFAMFVDDFLALSPFGSADPVATPPLLACRN